jgi:hypothetical protein
MYDHERQQSESLVVQPTPKIVIVNTGAGATASSSDHLLEVQS